MEDQLEKAENSRYLIIGGDHNAQIGAGPARDGIRGRHGLARTNDAGEDLLDWAEAHGLAYVNSFTRQRSPGTWFSRIHHRWYELDGFFVRSNQRHSMAVRINTVMENAMSDHRPKRMKCKIFTRPWRESGPRRRRGNVKHEALKNEETKTQYRTMTQEAMIDINNDNIAEANPPTTTRWDTLARVMREGAELACGTRERKIENPWLVGKENEIEAMRNRIDDLVRERNRLDGERTTRNTVAIRDRVKEELKNERRHLNRTLRRWEREWWEEKADECLEACHRGDLGKMYKLLREIGTGNSRGAPTATTITTGEFREHFKEVSAHRFERNPEELEVTIGNVEDLRDTALAREENFIMNEVPTEGEIWKAIAEINDSAPGEDGVRISYIRQAGDEVKKEITSMIQFMFNNEAQQWEDSLKTGDMVPIFKKGSRHQCGNYRGVVLLAMGSRILARILAVRLRRWSEKMKLVDDNQAGFREGRSTADATQMMIRIQEDTADYNKRRGMENENGEREVLIPEARLLDLQKAYPRVNRPGLWMIMERYGLQGKCLESLKGLHELTTYKVKGREGYSKPWLPNRGLREGCPTSPVLFNIYHQAVIRNAEEARRGAIQERDEEPGIPWKYVPGSNFPSINLWERYNSEASRLYITCSLFADDTTILGLQGEMETGVNEIKEVMKEFEEKNNEGKEERLIFGDIDEDPTRMLGCWMGMKVDIKERKKRASRLWFLLKMRFKHTRLSKITQAKIFEACVESALLFDSHTRTWYNKEVKSLQQWVDRAYRYIWGGRRGPPLIRMQREHKNMYDVRSYLKVKSIRYKIEKRTLERIGHIMRMEEGRMTKKVVLGWFEELEKWKKTPGKKRKTLFYWKKLLREAGIDWTEIQKETQDRETWKSRVKERMNHLEKFEQQQGHHYEWGPNEETLTRNSQTRRPEEGDLRCDVEGCGKLCKSKAGLTIHKRWIHEPPRKNFECPLCTKHFTAEANLLNHVKRCEGEREVRPGVVACGVCGAEILRNNIARHRRTHEARAGTAGQAEEAREDRGQPSTSSVPGRARVYVANRAPCPICGVEQSTTNMRRHITRIHGGGH